MTLALVLGFVSLSTFGGSDNATAKSGSDRPHPAAVDFLLRLHDLPLGYDGLPGPLPRALCHPIEPGLAQPRLAAFLRRYSPTGCMAIYTRLFRSPGAGVAPLKVGTGALDAGSVAGAEAGLTVSRELLSHLLGDELPTEVPVSETIGDATRLYHSDYKGLFTPEEVPGLSSFLVWRLGDVVAALLVAGGSAIANDQAAVELAHRQQSHIEARTPYTPAEADDVEVPLEDPALKTPVYWLGRKSMPSDGLPPLVLLGAWASPSGAQSSPQASLFYADNLGDTEQVSLHVWSPRRWRQLEGRRGEPPASLSCATAHSLKLPNGRAQIFDGFGGFHPTCRKHAWHAYTARIYLPRAVVTVETMDICATCASAGTGPYDSFKGMATIARGLERRIRPPSP